MWHYINVAMNFVNRIQSRHWLMILIGVTIIGALCMRGFGSRKNY
jgi:hypothetical protein